MSQLDAALTVVPLTLTLDPEFATCKLIWCIHVKLNHKPLSVEICFLVHQSVLQQTGDFFVKWAIANLTLKVKTLKKHACGIGTWSILWLHMFWHQSTRLSIRSTQYIISTDGNEYLIAIFLNWNQSLNFTTMIWSNSFWMISWFM